MWLGPDLTEIAESPAAESKTPTPKREARMVTTPADLTHPKNLEAYCASIRDAINTHDPELFGAMCTEDVYYRDPSRPLGIHGRKAVIDLHVKIFEVKNDITVSFPDPPFFAVSPDGQRVAWEWIVNSTLPTPDGSRRPVELQGVDVLTLRDGLIAVYHGYFDSRVQVPADFEGLMYA
jgi:SnoaL-like domain